MKIRLKGGKVADVKTGQARRLIQAGEAVEVIAESGDLAAPNEAQEGDDEQPSAKRPKKNRRTDVSGD